MTRLRMDHWQALHLREAIHRVGSLAQVEDELDLRESVALDIEELVHLGQAKVEEDVVVLTDMGRTFVGEPSQPAMLRAT